MAKDSLPTSKEWMWCALNEFAQSFMYVSFNLYIRDWHSLLCAGQWARDWPTLLLPWFVSFSWREGVSRKPCCIWQYETKQNDQLFHCQHLRSQGVSVHEKRYNKNMGQESGNNEIIHTVDHWFYFNGLNDCLQERLVTGRTTSLWPRTNSLMRTTGRKWRTPH